MIQTNIIDLLDIKYKGFFLPPHYIDIEAFLSDGQKHKWPTMLSYAHGFSKLRDRTEKDPPIKLENTADFVQTLKNWSTIHNHYMRKFPIYNSTLDATATFDIRYVELKYWITAVADVVDSLVWWLRQRRSYFCELTFILFVDFDIHRQRNTPEMRIEGMPIEDAVMFGLENVEKIFYIIEC